LKQSITKATICLIL